MTRQAAMVAERLRRQGLIRPAHRTPEGVVAWFGAMQAQEALLLPIYDEYLVAYRDRVAVPHSQARITKVPGWNVTFQHAVVINGQVAGTWRIPRVQESIAIDATLVRGVSGRSKQAVMAAAKRYGRFRRMPVIIELRTGRTPSAGRAEPT